MKKKFTFLMAACIMLLMMMVLPGKAVGQTRTSSSYTIEFKSNSTSGDSNNAIGNTPTLSNIIDSGSDYITSIPTSANVYLGAPSNGLKFGSSKNNGSMTMNLSSSGQVTATKIIVKARRYNGNKASIIKIQINGSGSSTTINITSGTLSDYEWTLPSSTEITSIYLEGQAGSSGDRRIYVKSLTVTYEVAGPTQLATPTNFAATAGNTQATFTWDEVANASNYTIFAKNGDTWDNPTTLFDNVSLDNGQYVGTGLTNGTTYICKVRANGDGTNYSNSNLSNEISVTPGVTQYNVTIANGITGGTVTASPTSAAAGATITVTANADAGYHLTELSYTYDQTTTNINQQTMQFEMPDSSVTINATFTAYTVTLYAGTGTVNGVSTCGWNVTMNNGDLPDAVAPCNTWTFEGWSTANVSTQTETRPTTFVETHYVPTTTTPLYAVYKKTESGGSFDSTNGGDYKIYAAVTANNTTTNYYAQGTGTKLNSTTTSSNATTYTFEKPSGANYGNNEFAIYTMVNNTKTYITYSGSNTDLGTSNNAYKWTLSTGTKGTWRVTSGTTGRALIFRASTTNKFGGYSTGNVTANGTEYYDLEIGGGSTTYYHSTPDCMETVATPTFDTEAGTYDETQIILIECETDGAAIYYTLNGDEPTNSPSETNFLYDEEEGVEISVTTTLKAKAYKTGMHESTTASATYTIVHDVAEPTLPASQPFTTNTYSVTITVPENTTVYYTTDNSTPSSTNGTQFTTAFPISATTTVKAIAYDNDGCASDVVSATYTRAYTLAGAKALYNGSAVSDVTISLAGVQFIAKSGSYTYVQQGETGLLIYGTNNNSWDNGDVFTAGTVTGTITKYKENMEMTSFTFSGVEKEAGSLTASATNVAITDITGNFATYEDRYIALTSLTMNLADLTLSDATNTLAIYDCLSALDGAVQPSDNVVVKGIVTSYTNNSNVTTYQIIPLAKTGITTGFAAALPTLAPAGGATAGEAPETATVTVTPATNTTVTYQFGEAYDEITSATVLTVPSTTATALELVASRVFYNDNEATYYYKTSAPTWAITFYVNGSVDPSLAKEVLQGGNPIGTLPSVEAPSGYVHMGWAESTISTVQASAPPMVTSSTTVNNNMTLYAVFAIQTAPAQESYWTKITDLSTVTAGTYALLTENDYAFNGELSAKFIGQHTTSAFSFDGEGKATSAPEGTLELTLAASGSGFTMYNSTKGYLYASGAAKENLKWQESEDSYWSRAYSGGNYGWRYSKSYSGSYGFLRTLSSDNTFRTYGNLSNQELYMAKKTNGSPATYADYCTTVSTPSIPSTVSGSATIGDGEHAYTLESPITVSSNGVLTITGPFANSNPSLLIIEDGGQLVTTNSVKATFNKTTETSSAKPTNNWYAISSPVNNVAIESFAQGTHNVYRYDEPTRYWHEYHSALGDNPAYDNLANGCGYLYRSTVANIAFAGDVNVADAKYTLKYTDNGDNMNGFNLIGNPFSYDIYKNKEIPNTNLEDNFYILETNGGWTLSYDYGTAELAGPTKIKPNTGILVQAKSTANDNTLTISRSSKGGENKYGKDQISFRIENSEYSDIACVIFKEGHGLNKVNHRNAEIPMLYITKEGEDFASANMPDNTSVINIGFDAKTMGQYTFSLKAEGRYSYMHLIDKLTGEDVDMLIEDSYTFMGSPRDRKDRFVLRLNYNAAGIDTESDIFAYQSGSDIIVSGEGELQIFDVMGRMVMNQRINGVETINGINNGVYIFKLEGKTQKIVVR